MMVLRAPSENEMIPSVVKEGKPVKEFEPDFFIVNVAHGQPKIKKDYNYLKNYDFPVIARANKNIVSKKEYKDYIAKHKKEASQRKFANFQLLIYLADAMDIDTAVTVAQHVAEEKPLDPSLVELLESI